MLGNRTRLAPPAVTHDSSTGVTIFGSMAAVGGNSFALGANVIARSRENASTLTRQHLSCGARFSTTSNTPTISTWPLTANTNTVALWDMLEAKAPFYDQASRTATIWSGPDNLAAHDSIEQGLALRCSTPASTARSSRPAFGTGRRPRQQHRTCT